MASGASLRPSIRMLLIGWPGGGKTGAVSSLLDAGFKVRMIDLEGNYTPLLNYADPRAVAQNLDVLTFQDKLQNLDKFIAPVGVPTAFNDTLKALKDWKTEDPEGNIKSLGATKDWGPDTIILLDSLTALGEAAFRRARVMSNKTPMNTTQAVWGLAVDDQVNTLKILNNRAKGYHVIVTGHLQMISPREIAKDDDDTVKEIKEAVADLIPTRLFPKGITKNSSQTIAKEFDLVLLAESAFDKKDKPYHRLVTVSRPELDLKAPSPRMLPEYPIETGLATIFETFGFKGPGLKE